MIIEIVAIKIVLKAWSVDIKVVAMIIFEILELTKGMVGVLIFKIVTLMVVILAMIVGILSVEMRIL